MWVKQWLSWRVSGENQHYRNRRIGEFLKEIHLTEGRNTGFRKILRALEHNGSSLPEFEMDEKHGFFITRLRRHPAFAEAAPRETVGESSDNGKISDKISDKVADHRQRVTALLSLRGHAQTNEIAEELGIKPPRMRQLLAEEGPNTVDNGILMRSDMHALFDAGCLTIDYDRAGKSRVVVSGRLHEDFGNGKDYYPYHGRRLAVVPDRKRLRPAQLYLDWHHDNVFLG